MPNIRPIKSKTMGTRWRADVWIKGIRESKRFATKPEAVAWAYQREAEISTDGRLVQGQTMGAALTRYAKEDSPKKRGVKSEVVRLKRLGRDPIANHLIRDINLRTAEEYRDRRLKEVQPSSVTREMTVMAAVLRRAVKWDWIAAYPWDGFDWPRKNPPRSKVYTLKEIEAIMIAAGVNETSEITTRAQQAVMAFLFAIETAARQSEIARLEWSDIDLVRRVAHLSETKNGEPRDIPLSTQARTIVKRMPRHHIKPWPMSGDSISQHFMRVRKAAGIMDGTFHDSRRCACVRLAKKLAPMDLAKVTGHKDLKMLLNVYYRADAEALADLLD